MLHKAERGLGRSDAAIHNGDWSVSRVPSTCAALCTPTTIVTRTRQRLSTCSVGKRVGILFEPSRGARWQRGKIVDDVCVCDAPGRARIL
jgi:hypothetical protein